MNKLSYFTLLLQAAFINFFRSITRLGHVKIADSSRMEVCHIKREFTHKVMKNCARKSKSTMGWFYGFKLHFICNELMHILGFTITSGDTDDRKGLEMIWNNIFGMIIADAGYVGRNWQKKASDLGKHLFTAVKANMKKIMTSAQHALMKLRQRAETVLSVLKVRRGLVTSLPRSPLGYVAHYLWCLASYQLDLFFSYIFSNVPKISRKLGVLA
jgi:hypothetical protein